MADYALELFGLFFLFVYGVGVWVFVRQRLREQRVTPSPLVVTVVHRHVYEVREPNAGNTGQGLPPVLHSDRN